MCVVNMGGYSKATGNWTGPGNSNKLSRGWMYDHTVRRRVARDVLQIVRGIRKYSGQSGANLPPANSFLRAVTLMPIRQKVKQRRCDLPTREINRITGSACKVEE